jgi:hypothetical protein
LVNYLIFSNVKLRHEMKAVLLVSLTSQPGADAIITSFSDFRGFWAKMGVFLINSVDPTLSCIFVSVLSQNINFCIH